MAQVLARKTDKRCTLKDVAKSAGVAWSTASYVLNNGPKPTSAKSRERVMAAAKELGYFGNEVARSLKTGQSRVLGALVYKLDTPFATQQLAGIEEAVQAAGYRMVVVAHLGDPQRALALLGDMASWNVGGIIAVSSLSIMLPQVKAQLTGLGLPHSYTFGELEGHPLADYVTIDHEQGAYIAVSHLIDRGRTKIVYLGGPADRPATRHRLDGYRRALADRNIDFDRRLVFFANDFFAKDADAITEDILALTPRPDALFAASDALAAALQRTYRRIGVRMPDDIAMVGFDNDRFCDSLDPALTSVSMPLYDVGSVVAKRMIARIENSEEWTPTTIALPCDLIVRQSS